MGADYNRTAILQCNGHNRPSDKTALIEKSQFCSERLRPDGGLAREYARKNTRT